jgi:hypothetical protein
MHSRAHQQLGHALARTLVDVDGIGYGPATVEDVAAILDGTSALSIGPIAEHPFIKPQQRLTFARAGKTRPSALPITRPPVAGRACAAPKR